MACISKLELLHPVRKDAIVKGLITMCDSCANSMYTQGYNSKPVFKKCSETEEVPPPMKDCSYFIIASEVLNHEESRYYEEKGIRWD